MAIKKNIPLSSPGTREEISKEERQQFVLEYEAWKHTVRREETGWEFYAAHLGLIRLQGVYLAPSGFKRCLNWSVVMPTSFMRFSKLYSAMQEHYAKVDYAKRKEVEELAANAFPA